MGKDCRYNIQLDPNNAEHMQVAHILDKLGRGEKRQLIVNAILAYTMNKKDERAGTGINPEALREIVRSMVIEVLNDCDKSTKSVETDKQDERKSSFNSVPPTPKEDLQTVPPEKSAEMEKKPDYNDIMKSLKGFM